MNPSISLIQTSSPLPHVAMLTLNRPAKRNALNIALIAELGAACREAVANTAVRCIVLSGASTFFSAGADIGEMREHGFSAIHNHERVASWNDVANCSKPIVAAIEGICFGGGHELAMLADIIIAGNTALFGQPEINIGVIPGDGGTQRLPRVVGKALAMQMVLTGQPIPACRALEAGLVSEVVEPGQALQRALEIAGIISQKPPRSVELAKAAVLASYKTTLDVGLDVERQAIRYAFTTADQQEGMSAFLEKRPPHYRGA